MSCVSLSVGIIFRYEKFMCIFSFFRKMKIERNTKLKLIAYIQDVTCYKMSLIEAPKLVSIKQKRKKEKICRGWTDNFSTHCMSMSTCMGIMISLSFSECRTYAGES